MVWGERQDRLGDLPGLWPLLPFEGLDTTPRSRRPLRWIALGLGVVALLLRLDNCILSFLTL